MVEDFQCPVKDECLIGKCPGESCPIKRKIDSQAAEIQFLKQELAELRAKMYGRKHKKNNDEEGEEELPAQKKRGAPRGHPGWYRKKPDKIDKVIEVKSSCCPHCGNKHITPCRKVEEHIQEDIVLPMVKATLYRKRTYYCNKCQANFSGRGKDELLNSYIGPTAKTLACILKYDIKVSDRGIHQIFKNLFNLKVSTGSVPGFRDQLSRRGVRTYGQMIDVLRKSAYAHCDETGWNVDGENHWLWSFSNNKVSVFHIDKSRGQKVVKEILSDEYRGILISDFLSAYNKIIAKGKQRCLVHLKRDLKQTMERFSADESIVRWCAELKKLINRAIELDKDREAGRINKKAFLKRRKDIEKALEYFQMPPDKKEIQRFTKRVLRHKDELLTFLYYEGIAYHNNHAEQQLRMNVILKKITNGNRSLSGVNNHNIIMSILKTALLNGLNPFDVMKEILVDPGKSRIDALIRAP